MTEHFSSKLIERFRGREVSPEDLTVAESHLGQCEMCRQQLAEAMRVQMGVQAVMADLAVALEESNHPAIDLLANYIEDELDDVESENIKTHLESCQMCTDDVRDLQEGMVADLKSFIEERPSSKRSNLWERFSALAHWPVQSKAIQIAIVMLIVVVALPVTILLLRLTSSKPQTEISQSPSSVSKSGNPELTTPTDQSNTFSQSGATAQLRPPNSNAASTTIKSPGQLQSISKPNTSQQDLLALNASDKNVLEELSPATQRAIRTAIEAQNISKPAILAMLFNQASVLRQNADGETSFKLLYPKRIVIAEDRPTFKWKSLKGASGYQVNIIATGFKETEKSPELSSTITQWTPPG
ncbi:MAG: anti-sigma factor family protein, partial [Pyrinomonadaceae bacterium]